VRRKRDFEEEAWEAFDATLRGVELPEPPASLRDRCLPPRRACRVLAVDDEPNIRRLIQTHLSRAGYQVLLACDGEEALALARAEQPEIIILDVMMPGMDGFQVLEALKSDPRTSESMVVMLTARSGDDPMRYSLRAGVDLYLTKPFHPEELRAVIDRFAAVLGTPENPPPLRRWPK
jgi:CheY-like chemotaxis protein